MRRSLRRAALFALIIVVLCLVLDYAVTAGLRRTEMPQYVEWNAIVSGKASSDIIIQGSSRAWVDFSPAIIGDRLGMTCYNMGVDGYPLDMELARYRLCRKYDQKPKIIVQSLDTYSLNTRDDLYMNNQFLPYLNEDAIRQAVEPYHYFKWYDYELPLVRYKGKFDLICRGLAEFFRIHHFTNAKDRGYQGQDREWSNEFDEFVKSHPNGVDQKYLQSMVDALDGFLAECGRDGITVVLVYPPEYYKSQAMTNNREEIFAIYRRLSQKYGLQFLDYSYDPISYDTKYFYNSQHLNRTGAEMFSTELAEKLAELVGDAHGSAAALR